MNSSFSFEINEDHLNPHINILAKGKLTGQILLHGSTLNQLVINDLNLIKGYELNQRISFADCRGSWLFPFPNRIRDGRFDHNNLSYQFPINEPERNNAIHGLIRDQFFSISEAKVVQDEALVTFTYQYDGGLTYFPFSFNLIIHYSFRVTGLNIVFKILNTGNKTLPWGLGWHPYFAAFEEKVDTIQWKFPKVRQIKLDERNLPVEGRYLKSPFAENPMIGEKCLDDLYELMQPGMGVSWKNGKDSGIQMEYSENIKYLQLYTPADRSMIAVEPMTCSIDAFNNGHGLQTLQPGKYETITIEIKPI